MVDFVACTGPCLGSNIRDVSNKLEESDWAQAVALFYRYMGMVKVVVGQFIETVKALSEH